MSDKYIGIRLDILEASAHIHDRAIDEAMGGNHDEVRTLMEAAGKLDEAQSIVRAAGRQSEDNDE